MQNAINVSFRLIGTDGEVIALWREPEQTGKMVSSYMHIGQHSEAHESLIGDLLSQANHNIRAYCASLNLLVIVSRLFDLRAL